LVCLPWLILMELIAFPVLPTLTKMVLRLVLINVVIRFQVMVLGLVVAYHHEDTILMTRWAKRKSRQFGHDYGVKPHGRKDTSPTTRHLVEINAIAIRNQLRIDLLRILEGKFCGDSRAPLTNNHSLCSIKIQLRYLLTRKARPKANKLRVLRMNRSNNLFKMTLSSSNFPSLMVKTWTFLKMALKTLTRCSLKDELWL